MIWTDELCARIVQDMTESGKNRTQLAQELTIEFGEPIHPEQLRSAVRRYIKRSSTALARQEQQLLVVPEPIERLIVPNSWTGVIHDDDDDDIRFPEPARNIEQDVLLLEDPNVLIIGDIHAPYHSVEMLNRAVNITQKHFSHIKHCMIIGDLFDFSAISTHLNNQPTTSTEYDMRAGGKIARELRKLFELWIGPGNHDERISKKLNSEFSMESLLCGALGNSDPGLHLTDYDYFYIGEDIIAGHPSLYSSKPTGVAAKTALMQRKNIITGHSHKVGITVSDDGVHWVVDNGHCADDSLFYYVRRRLSTFGKMGAGFTVVSNGKPFVFGEAITDWSRWL